DHAVGLDAIPIPGGAASNGSVQAHRVVGDVVASAVAVVAEQGRDGVPLAVSCRQRLIDCVLHHCALGPVAVMAAKAGEKALDVGLGVSYEFGCGRQNFDRSAGGGDGLSVEVAGVLAPEDSLT